MSENPKNQKPIKSSDLKFQGLFHQDSETGKLYFNQRRIILFDVEALGKLRKQLIETIGEEFAMGIFTRFGYESGYNDAKKLGESFNWESDKDWLAAGPVLHILEGIVNVKPQEIEFDRTKGSFHMHGIWEDSYEAEIHIINHGLSKHTVCWTLTGYATGYASCFFGSRLLAIETECIGKGDKRCYWEIRPEKEWGREAKRYIKALKAANVISQLRQLQLTGERFHDIAMSSADWIWETDSSLRYVYCSEQIAEALGYSFEYVLGRTFFDFMPSEEAVRVKEIYRELYYKKGAIDDLEVRYVDAENNERIMLVNGVPILDESDNISGYRGVTKDITRQKEAEKQLVLSEERYRRITQAVTDYIYAVRLHEGDRVETVHGPGCVSVTGYSEQEFAQDPYLWIRMVHPDDRTLIQEKAQKLLEGRDATPVEHRIFRKDGKLRWVSNTPVLHFDKDGRLLGYDGLIQDITDRKLAEEALQESEARYRSIFENSPIAIWEEDFSNVKARLNQLANDGVADLRDYLEKNPDEVSNLASLVRVLRTNEKSLKILGYPDREQRVEELPRYFTDESLRIFKDEIIALASGSTGYSCEIPVRNSIGETLILFLTLSVVSGHEKNLSRVVVSFIDITEAKLAEQEKKKLEEQLLQSRKMESIGTLAGGIAHDFNNLLMGILGYTSLMLLKTEETHPFYQKLKSIERQVESGAELTKQLLGFARGGKYQVRTLDLNDIINETSELFGRTRKAISIQKNLQYGLHSIEADKGQIEQVLLNLFLNASQAMPGGGELYISTENAYLDEQACIPHDIKPGLYVKTIVADTGVGMDKEMQLRIFDPFFTTRGPGEGTGLGLASVYGIIKNHGGAITVQSEKGRGSAFTFYLPANENEFHADFQQKETDVVTGNETVLVVDDEKINTEALKELLEILGYKPMTADNGKKALELFKKHRNEIKLVILDMIMQGISGRETFIKLREIDPDVRVLLSSGYSIEGEATEIMELGCKGFIQKPFRVDELSQKIRSALDS